MRNPQPLLNRHRPSRTLTFAKAAAALWLVAAPALAQSAADLETARSLYREARAARDAGDTATALAKFRAAYAAAPTPIIAVELGKTQSQLGLLLEANETFLSVSRIKVAPDESEYSAQARADAQTLAEGIRPRISAVVVVVPAGRTASLSIDGNVIVPELIGQPRKVNPGKHELVAQYTDGASENITINVAEGKTEQVLLKGAAPPTDASRAGGTQKPSAGTPHPLRAPFMYTGFAVAGAGVVLGTVSGIIALGKSRDFKALCQGTRCQPQAAPIITSARTWSTVSTISFIVSGVGASVGIVGLLLKPSQPSNQASVSLGFGFGSATLSGRF